MNKFWIDFKSFLSEYKYVLLILLVIVASVILFKNYLNKRRDAINVADIVKAQKDSIDYYKDQNGKLHAQVIAQQGSQDIINSFYKPLIDSLSKELGVKSKQVQDYISIINSTSGQFTTVIDTIYVPDTTLKNNIQTINIDTTYIVPYKDNWLTFNGYFKPRSNKFQATYNMIDSLTFITYYKNSGFLGLGPKKWFLNIQAQNPATIIKNIKDFQIISDKPKPFSIGPSVIVTYQNSHFSLVPGIGIQYNLIRF